MAAKQLRKLGWVRFIQSLQHPSDLAPTLATLPHPAGPYLHRLHRCGVPAPSSAPPWPQHLRRRVLAKGPHLSASKLYKDFLHQDMIDYVRKRFWVVLPYSAVAHYPHLKLAPSRVVPQRERRPRPIMDYTITGVNQHSLPLAYAHSMQIGQTLPRILQRLAYANPKYGPPSISKFDLSDGYYRVRLSPEAALELAVILPGENNQANLIGIPLSLPMGWAYSPPYFCSFTETAADLANQQLKLAVQPTSTHPLELTSQLPTVPVQHNLSFHPKYIPPPGPAVATPLQYVDVYIDDFLALAQQPTQTCTLHHTIASLLKIFRDDPLPQDPPLRRHIISESKVYKGDAAWSTNKAVLGWNIDTAAGTLSLPPHKADRLRTLLKEYQNKTRTSRRSWQRLLGELRHMATAIRGAGHLFSVLQHVLTDTSAPRIRLSKLVKSTLADWHNLASSLTTHPVPLVSLVPRAPSYVGAVDASAQGCGGFWMPTTYGRLEHPTFFRCAFPPSIQHQLVSTVNPTGQLTNSDLELAAMILGQAVLQHIAPSTAASALIASDNTPAVSWVKKGSSTSVAARAFLLRWLAQLTHRNLLSLTPIPVPGTTNNIADLCSRSFHLSDQQLLEHMNNTYPTIPCWTIAHPPPEATYSMISALLRRPLPWEFAPPAPTQCPTHSKSGKPSAGKWDSTPPWQLTPIQSPSSRSSLIDTEWAQWLPAKLKCVAEQWVTPFVPWDRRSPDWVTLTPGYRSMGNWTSACHASFPPTRSKITHQPESSPFRLPYFNKPLQRLASQPALTTRQ